MATAGPLFNTSNTVGVSGMARSFVNFYGDQKYTAIAGSGSQTVTSGAGVLFGVIGITGSLLSGQAALPAASFSGVSVMVVDGISGVIVQSTSGAATFAANTNGILYYWNGGLQSGSVGISGVIGLPVGPPTLTAIDMIFKSGLVAVCSGGAAGSYGISLLYSKGY